MVYGPLALLFMFLLFVATMLFFVLVQINLIALAFSKIGIPTQYVFSALLATLAGSYFNIPIKRIPQKEMCRERMVRFFGVRYAIPRSQRQETILAVNVGGAIIPVLISIYLLFRGDIWLPAGVATAVMIFATHRLARPIEGLGIGLPILVPPLLAALLAVLLAPTHTAPLVAYVCGTLGALIGADLLNLDKIACLGAPVASIGGAGTFDGIFLNGILAVLLSASLS